MKQPITCCADEAKASHTSDTDEADTTRPGTDEAKAANQSELARPDIYIIGHRQAGGAWLSIARRWMYRPAFHFTTIVASVYTKLMEKTRLEDEDHCNSSIGGGPRL